MKLSKEAKIGLIVTIGIAALFWGINFLKGKDFFSSKRTVYAVYDQVEGLTASSPVTINGLKIGLISKLKLLEEDKGRVLVTMQLTHDIRLPKNSTAQIFSTDILGSKGVKIIMGNSDLDLLDGDTLQSGMQLSLPEEVNAQVAPIKAKAENLLSSMDSVLLVIREVFNERTKINLKRSFESISNSLVSIENIAHNFDTSLSNGGRLMTIFQNLESISTNLKNNNEKINLMIDNFSAISDTIARSNISQTLENTSKALEQTAGIMTKVNNGEGSLGQLANNDSLYHNLNNTAFSLDALLKDFKENPGRYVKFSLISFGKKSSKKN